MPDGAGGSTFDCDVLVVDGGINGAGIARDLTSRGLACPRLTRTTDPATIHNQLGAIELPIRHGVWP